MRANLTKEKWKRDIGYLSKGVTARLPTNSRSHLKAGLKQPSVEWEHFSSTQEESKDVNTLSSRFNQNYGRTNKKKDSEEDCSENKVTDTFDTVSQFSMRTELCASKENFMYDKPSNGKSTTLKAFVVTPSWNMRNFGH